jgi:hypothetical protein
LQLHRHAGRAGALDQLARGGDDRRRRGLGGRIELARRRVRGQRAGVGVDPETDLAAPLLDERGEPVGERRAQAP